ncbi:zinc finger protein 81-like [Esox lucius]|uniref:C2H2-type domain-containing protein n=1 Tax=Esox lucius TaxID=8010 RepID=A0AAY5L9P4_ESOLU|nr:zinc finger protein 81-like [Esox lucius]
MSKIQLLRVFFNQRLTAAAEEIFGAVEKTIAEYQEEVCRSKEVNDRLQRQLEIALKSPDIHNDNTTDIQQLSLTVFEEGGHPEQQRCEEKWSPGLSREDPEEPAHIKEEQQEQLRSNQEETFHVEYISSKDCVSSDYGHMKDTCPPSHLYLIQNEEYGQDIASTSSEQIKTEPDGGYGFSDPTSDPRLLSAVNPGGFPSPTEFSEGVSVKEKEPWVRLKPLKSKRAQKSTTGQKSGGIWKNGRKFTELLPHLDPNGQTLPAPCWCGLCGEKFDSVVFLIKHTQEHPDDPGPDCLCGVCGKHLESRLTLTEHLQTHMKNLFCHFCGQCFNWTSNLKRHMMIHTGERPYRCGDCGKGFRSSDCLTKHRRIHTGDKPFPCPVCRRGFNRRDNLKVHMRIHTGERPYICPECYKCFATLTSLNKHQTMHNEERPYACTDCGTRFKALESQKRHMKSVHNKKENTT